MFKASAGGLGRVSNSRLIEMWLGLQSNNPRTAERVLAVLLDATENDPQVEWCYGLLEDRRYTRRVFDEQCEIRIGGQRLQFPVGILSDDWSYRFCRSAERMTGQVMRSPIASNPRRSAEAEFNSLRLREPKGVLLTNRSDNIPVEPPRASVDWEHPVFHQEIVAAGKAAQAAHKQEQRGGHGRRQCSAQSSRHTMSKLQEVNCCWALLFTCALRCKQIKMICKTPGPIDGRSHGMNRDLFRLIVPGTGGLSIPPQLLTRAARLLFLRSAEFEERPPRSDTPYQPSCDEFISGEGFATLGVDVPAGILATAV